MDYSTDRLGIYGRYFKIPIETVLAMGLIVAFLPLFILIPVLIKLTSKGPVLYLSKRVGKNGRLFTLLKFRSMKINSQVVRTTDNLTVVTADDPRLTPIGRILRMGFDELPQFFNILQGDMALIGPRPDELEDLATYDEATRKRLILRPGITGLAAICNSRTIPVSRRYVIDIYYLEHLSWWFDVTIAILTPMYMLGFQNSGKRFQDRIFQDTESR